MEYLLDDQWVMWNSKSLVLSSSGLQLGTSPNTSIN